MPKQIVFHHREFEYEVRKQILKPEGTITDQDILNIKELDCSNFNFDPNDLDTLNLCLDLEVLFIDLYDVDLSFLSAFSKLKELSIVFNNRNNILDFTVFSELRELETLFVSGGDVSDIDYVNLGSLTKLKKLKELLLHEFGTVDLAFLEQMPWLEEFFCGWANKVRNIDSIGKLQNLKALDLTDVEMDNLDFLDHLPDEMSLTLCGDIVHSNVNMEKLNRFSESDVCEMTINGQYYS